MFLGGGCGGGRFCGASRAGARSYESRNGHRLGAGASSLGAAKVGAQYARLQVKVYVRPRPW